MESCTTAQPSGKWKSRKRRAWSLRCERVHGSGSEKGGEGCAIRCDGWQDKVFKCHEIQPSKAHERVVLLVPSSPHEAKAKVGRRGRAGGEGDAPRSSCPISNDSPCHTLACWRGVKRSHDARCSGAPVGCIASRDQALQRVPGLPRRRRRRPPSFALLANGDTRKWVLTGPVSLRDGMEGGREAEGYNRAPFTPRAAKPVD